MSPADAGPVVVDTMVVSALVNASRDPSPADDYRTLIDGRSIVVSFASVLEQRPSNAFYDGSDLPSGTGSPLADALPGTGSSTT